MPGDNKWHNYSFELSASLGYPITSVYIYFDGSSTSIKSGNVEFDNFDLGIPKIPNDTSLLSEASEVAGKLQNFITEGTSEGQYPFGSKDKLQSVINNCDSLIIHANIYTQGYIDTASNGLFDSITNVEKSVIISTNPLNDKHATKQTINLYKNLQFVSSKHHTLYGQHDAFSSGVNWYDDGSASKTDAGLVTGSNPAVNGQDANNVTGSAFSSLVIFKNSQVKTYSLGGINTLVCHLPDPKYGQIYYSSLSTPYNVVQSLLPGGTYNSWYKEKLWHLALYLKSLRGSHGESIPVIYRPFHEHNGNWFWWGTGNCTTAQFDSIWHYFQIYMRDSLDIHNLIYIISPDGSQFTAKAQYEYIYPGDNYVDIFGLDYYFRTTSSSATTLLTNQLDDIVEYADASNKLAALSEFGDLLNGNAIMSIPDFYTSRVLAAVKNNSESSRIAYLASWSNSSTGSFFAPYPGQAQVPDFLNFYDDTSTLFMNDLVDMYDSVITFEFEKPMQGCRIKSFSINSTAATVDVWQPGIGKFYIKLNLSDTVNLTSKIPVFVLSEGSTVKVNGIEQISGTSAQNFSDTVAYVVIAQNNIDSSVYKVVVSKGTGTFVNSIATNKIIVSPNPAVSYINISGIGPNSVVEIYNIFGQKLYKTFAVSDNLKINVGNFAAGTYIVSISGNKNIFGKVKFIKE